MRKLRYTAPVTDVVSLAGDALLQDTEIILNSKVKTTPEGDVINANESGWDDANLTIPSAPRHNSLWDGE